ncbi:hypothetical protein HMPREF6745_0572 [Prevotella sp. oral taxon 472 str. F0295]|nr:hypothetical protein HMPREF6745_0572 [Prevotella sp. oral taxon 472 str. F0295]
MQVRMFVKHGQARKLANFFVCLPNCQSSNIIYPHAAFYKLFAIINPYINTFIQDKKPYLLSKQKT